MRTKTAQYLFIGILALAAVAAVLTLAFAPLRQDQGGISAAVLQAGAPFLYSFTINGILNEAGSEAQTTSPYWWLNSGGKLILKDGIGMTVQGSLPIQDLWRVLYAKNNSLDTDLGYHPQNLFRLVSRNSWKNPRVEANFYIAADNLSASPNRNQSNGLLLFSEYQDSSTLYYEGIRVDGTAVIKKKYKGTYYTMAQKQIFPGTYNLVTNPNLLPHNEWISLRAETVNASGTTTIRLYMRRAGETAWTQLLSATDNGSQYGNTPVIDGSNRVGIRTDFMDVWFDNFQAQEL